MRKIAIIVMIIFLLPNFFMLKTVKASEDEYNFYGYTWGYSSGYGDSSFLRLKINWSHPSDIPHRYEPYPEWRPLEYETYEELFLIHPNMTMGIGSWDTNEFYFMPNPASGEYQMQIIENSTKLLFTHNFSMNYSFNVNLNSAKWIIEPTTLLYRDSVEEENIFTIKGIQLSLNIENTGDIPIAIGTLDSWEMNIYYQFFINKDDNTQPIYTSNIQKLARPVDAFKGQDYTEKQFFKPKEILNCNEKIINSTIYKNLENYGVGKYSINGYVIFDRYMLNLTYNFSLNDMLTITKETKTPGFEIIPLMIALSFIVIWKRLRRKK